MSKSSYLAKQCCRPKNLAINCKKADYDVGIVFSHLISR